MRSSFWLSVILLASVAIVAGFLSGESGVHPPPTVALHPRVPLGDGLGRVVKPRRITAEAAVAVKDLFADDDVVVERTRRNVDEWFPEQFSVVVGLCGASATAESRFLSSRFPIAFDLDPQAPDAPAVAKLIRAAHDVLLVHLDHVPSMKELEELRSRVGRFEGVAARVSDGMAAALRTTGLSFFDERGDAERAPFAQRGVRLTRRDVTVDDRGEPSYVDFMLGQAAARSAHQADTVVFMRPLPDSYAALAAFLRDHDVRVARL